MKFGIFYELQLPRPWTDDADYNLIHNALEQVEVFSTLNFIGTTPIASHDEFSDGVYGEMIVQQVAKSGFKLGLVDTVGWELGNLEGLALLGGWLLCTKIWALLRSLARLIA